MSTIVSDTANQTREGTALLYTTLQLVFQSFIYGIYCLLFPFTLRLMKRKGLTNNFRRTMYWTSIIMFIVTSIWWILSVLTVCENILLHAIHVYSPHFGFWAAFFDALVGINYGLADCMIFWRAWVLCADEQKSRKALQSSIFFLAWVVLSITATIIIRILLMIQDSDPSLSNHNLTIAIDLAQSNAIISSILFNILVTVVVLVKGLRHRATDSQKPNVLTFSPGAKSVTDGGNVLTLIVESGFLYFVSGIIFLVFIFIKLPHGTLGDLYFPIAVQIAAIYPTLILIVVHLKAHWKQTISPPLRGRSPSQINTVVFNSGPQPFGTVYFPHNPPPLLDPPDEMEYPGHSRNGSVDTVIRGIMSV